MELKEIIEYALMAGMAAMVWGITIFAIVFAWKVFKE